MKTATKSQGLVMNMTEGKPQKLILLFALPILLGNIFQQFYNIVDTMIAGRYLGDQALAAIGATSAIYGMILSLVSGMNTGYTIIVARAFGEKNFEKVRNSVALMLVLNTIASVLFTILAVLFIQPLLRAINTPADIFQDAYKYIVVILIGLTITIFYNMEAGVLRALGNSKTPLIYLVIASFLNIFFDILFVVVFKLSVTGLALATVLAQTIAVVLCYIHIHKHYKMIALQRHNFKFDKEAVSEMLSTGISAGLMYSIFNIGTVVLQGAINTFGTMTITAHLAARKIDGIFTMPLGTLSSANATFVSQNYGAKKMHRVKEGIRMTCLLGFAWAAVVTTITLLFAEKIVVFLTSTSDTYIIETASMYLRINIPFFFVLCVLLVLRTSLQGIGKKIVPLVSSVIELVAKIAATWIVIPILGYLGVCIVEPALWCICMVWLIVSYVRTMGKLKIKKI